MMMIVGGAVGGCVATGFALLMYFKCVRGGGGGGRTMKKADNDDVPGMQGSCESGAK